MTAKQAADALGVTLQELETMPLKKVNKLGSDRYQKKEVNYYMATLRGQAFALLKQKRNFIEGILDLTG
jgi:hypothetical protein